MKEQKKLTARQEKFCVAYAACGNGTKAAIEAGYSAKGAQQRASTLMEMPEITARLRELTELYLNEHIADVQEMQVKLTSIIRQEATEERIITLFQGDYSEVQRVDKHPDLKDVISAIGMLGKMQGAFNERVTLDILPTVIKDDIPNE